STRGNDGSRNILITFDVTRDPDLATVDIQNRVHTALGRLPGAVKSVGITTEKTSLNFVFFASVISFTNRYPTLFISRYRDVYVRYALQRIPGVAGQDILGACKCSMRVWLDPVRMSGRGLTPPDVVNTPSEHYVEAAPGQIGQQPTISGQQYQ